MSKVGREERVGVPDTPDRDAIYQAARILRGTWNQLHVRAGLVGLVTLRPGGLAAVEGAEEDLRKVIEWLEWLVARR